MTPRPFLRWPDPRLKTPADPIEAVTNETRAIWDEMLEAMYAMPGVGLAAPQLGIMQRLAVVDDGNGPLRLANPVITAASAQMNTHEEGSPNLPGVWAKVTRPRAVSVRFLGEDGAEREEDFVLLRATSVQHQIDHLDGKMYFDRLSRTRRDMLLKKAAKCA